MSSGDNFLKAIIAGSQLAEERAARAARAFSGGGGRGGAEQQPAAAQNMDPHLAMQGSILSYVDPAQQAEAIASAEHPPAAAKAGIGYDFGGAGPQPFTAAGQQFITNPANNQAQPYVQPNVIEKVGDNLVRVDPKNFTAQPIFQGGTGGGVHLSEVDTSGMDPNAIQVAQMFNPPRVTGSPEGVSNYLHTATSHNPTGLPPKADEVVRTTKDGRKAVFNATTKQFLRYAE